MPQFLSNMSIRGKILTGSIAPLLMITLFVLIYYPIHDKKILYEAMQQRNHSMAEMVVLGVGTALGSGDFAAARGALDLAKWDVDLISVTVLDEKQQLVIKYNRDSLFAVLPKMLRSTDIQTINGRKVHLAIFPINYRNESYGTLIYISSLDSVDQIIYESTVTIIQVSMVLLLLGVLLSFIFSRMITRPLDQLRQAAIELADGQTVVPIPVNNSDEIGQLSRSFNSMSQNILNTMANLRESREQSRLIIKTAADAFVSINEKGEVVDWNSKAEQTFGWYREEILGTLLADSIVPRAYGAAYIAGMKRFLMSGKETILNKQIEISAMHHDGHEFPIELTVWVVSRHGQRYFNAFVRNITERIKNEEQLRKLSAAVEQSANMVAVIDKKSVIEYVNPQFTKITGFDAEDVIGQPMSFLYSASEDPQTADLILKSLSQGLSWSGKVLSQRKNGESCWIRQTVTPIRNDDGHTTNFLVIGEDVSDEHRMQGKMIEADKLTAIGTLAAGVAHEFKNYLCGIIGNASFALSELEDEQEKQSGSSSKSLSQETFEQIIEIGEKANEIAISLLSFSRESNDSEKLTEIGPIIESTLKLIDKNIKAKTIKLELKLGQTNPVKLNQNKIQQLILNLLINATQAVKSKGIITIVTSQSSEQLLVEVRDNGRGIEVENLNRIFDPFFSTKGVWGEDNPTGIGMGLTVCRNIAREHGGDLTVTSTLGQGSTFSLALPINSDMVAQKRVTEDSEQKEIASSIKLVMVCIDEERIRAYQAESLPNNCHITVLKDSSQLEEMIDKDCDMVLFDASYPAKIELLQGIELVMSKKTPTTIINCKHIRQAIPDICRQKVICFQQTPALSKIVSSLKTDRPVTV